MKILYDKTESMKIAIVNGIHVGKPLQPHQVMRAASHRAGDALSNLFAHITVQHHPDILINI